MLTEGYGQCHELWSLYLKLGEEFRRSRPLCYVASSPRTRRASLSCLFDLDHCDGSFYVSTRLGRGAQSVVRNFFWMFLRRCFSNDLSINGRTLCKADNPPRGGPHPISRRSYWNTDRRPEPEGILPATAPHLQVGTLSFLPFQFPCLFFLSPAAVWWPELPRAR